MMAWVWKGASLLIGEGLKPISQSVTKKQTLIRAKYQLWCHEGLSQIDIQINFARMFCNSIMKMFELCALVWFQWLCQL